jgi:hypothetical protein
MEAVIPRFVYTPVNEILVLLLTTIIGSIYSINTGSGMLGPIFSVITMTSLILAFGIGYYYIQKSSNKDPGTYFMILLVGAVSFIGVALLIFSILFHRSIDDDKKKAYITPNIIFGFIGGALFIFSLIAVVSMSIFGTISPFWLFFVDWFPFSISLGVSSSILLSAVMASY